VNSRIALSRLHSLAQSRMRHGPVQLTPATLGRIRQHSEAPSVFATFFCQQRSRRIPVGSPPSGIPSKSGVRDNARRVRKHSRMTELRVLPQHLRARRMCARRFRRKSFHCAPASEPSHRSTSVTAGFDGDFLVEHGCTKSVSSPVSCGRQGSGQHGLQRAPSR